MLGGSFRFPKVIEANIMLIQHEPQQEMLTKVPDQNPFIPEHRPRFPTLILKIGKVRIYLLINLPHDLNIDIMHDILSKNDMFLEPIQERAGLSNLNIIIPAPEVTLFLILQNYDFEIFVNLAKVP